MSSTHKEDLFTTKKRRADSNSNSFSLYGSDDEEDEVAKKKSSVTMRSGDGDNNSHESSLPDTGAVKIHTTTTVPDDNDSKTAVLGHQSFLLSVYAARKGEREEMQDRHLSIDNFDSILRSFMERGDNSRKRCAFYALFDGHAGKRAADFCSDVFVRQFTAVCKKYMGETGSMSTFEKSIKKIFVDTYKSIDDEFLKEARKIKPALKDGTTATTILLLGNTVYCANIGDSRAVVCRYKQERKESVPLQITVDHNPTVFEERMRIQKAGGVVKDGRVMGILEVSRSIGDGQLKTHGIICTPDIRKLTLTSSDPFLILACDGLWKTFTPESAVQFAIDHFVKAISSTKKDDIELWTSIADEMSADAIRRGCGDNVSVILIVLLGREELVSLFGT